MTDGTRRRALVTGASSGIGLAFARVLAERGYDLILTARRQDRLQALAKDLADRYSIRAEVAPLDLAETAACRQLLADLARRSIAVDVLINNAGFGVPGSYVNTTWSEQERFLQVLVVAVAELAHGVLPGMVERKWGRIVNVASLAGLLPGVAGHTLYAASKAFLIAFSESLALEAAPHGVHVTASCPGFTLTEFHDVTGTRDKVNRLPKFMWTDAETVARTSYDAVMAGVPVFVPGRVNRSIASVARVLPKSLVMMAMRGTAGSYRKT
jgi:short-subunit dehydrogenase